MAAQTFDTVLKLSERGRVYIEIPFAPATVWGKRSRYYVSGTLNGVEFHGSLGANGGMYFMPVNKTLQQKASLKVGDPVRVIMDRAEAEQAGMSDELAQALDASPTARAFFEALTTFQKNTYLLWVADAESPKTRSERISSTIKSLEAGQKQR